MKLSKIANILIFIIGSLSLINIKFLGLISVSEAFMVSTLPILMVITPKLKKPFSINRNETIGMILIWIISVCTSDYFNSTVLSKFLKGIGHPLVILPSFLYVNILLQLSKDLIKYFIVGLLVGSIIFFFIDDFAYSEFRFGLLNIIIYVGFIIIYFVKDNNRIKYTYFIITFLALIGFVKGGRSNGLLLFASLILFIYGLKFNKSTFNFKPKSIVISLIISIATILLFQELYIVAINNKVFNEQYQAKFETQLRSGLPIILSGRTEIYSSLIAIGDSPIFGHGSWASNPKYQSILDKLNVNDMSDEYYAQTISDRIPAHSFLFGEWVEHGFLGFLFFVFFGKRLFMLLAYLFNNINDKATPFLIFIVVTFIWHLFFSPLGYDKRLIFAFLLALNSLNIRMKLINKLRNKSNT